MAFEKGVISDWNDDKGFGFIKNLSSKKDVFFHINQYSKIHTAPIEGLNVKYQLSVDKKNRKCAVKVSLVNGNKKSTVAWKQLKSSLILSLLFFCFLGGLVLFKKLPIFIFYVYLSMSCLLFLLYAKDKSAAQKRKWRTPENTLHICSLLGGWPGAIIAQSKFRHKTSKQSFRIYYWITVLINCFILGWLLFTFEGQIFLEIFN